MPQLPCDLNVGIDSFVPKAADHAGVEVVIRAALAAGAPLGECSVLTFRNNLNKMLGTVNSDKDSWAVDGCLLRGTLFLDIVKQVQAWEEKPDQEHFVAWGYSFEAKCTGQAVADANSEYGVVIRTRLGQHRIYLGAELDCYDAAACGPGQPVPLAAFREVKTYPQPKHRGQYRTLYRYRHPKWWAQSYLAGVEALVLGGRDDQGIVHRIDVVKTADLPGMSQRFGEGWSPQQMLAFGADCLSWMRGVAERQPGAHVRFTYAPTTGEVRWEVLAGGDLPARLAAVLPAA